MNRARCPTRAALVILQAYLSFACGGGGQPPQTPAIFVSVSPRSATAIAQSTIQFTATVAGTGNSAVTWSVNGLVGGSSSIGMIDASGLYTAPAIPPSPNVVTVKAASVVDPSRTGSASVTVVNPAPTLSSLSPSTVDAGSGDTTLTVTGTGFTSQSTVQLSGTSLVTTFGSSTQLTAVAPAAQLTSAGTLPVTVVTPSPGGGTSNATNLTVVVVVTVSPSTQTLQVTQTQPFTATVTGSANQGVTWSVNDVAGGSATLGTIDASGLYTAPAIPPSPNVVTVKATSVVDPTRTGTASVTIVNPAPSLSSMSPTAVDAGSPDTTLTVTGTDFTPQSMVELSGTSLATSFVSSTQLTAVIPAAQLTSAGTLPVTVVTPSPGGGTSDAVNLTVRVLVAVSPSTQTLQVTQTQPFTATVTGSTNPGVTWSVNDIAGGNATVGSINSSGLYTAPAVPPVPNVVTVKAASVADPTRTASASVTVVSPAPTLGSISPSTVNAGSPDTTLTVTGTGFAQQSTVKLGGSALTTSFGSATQLMAVIPAAQLASAGTLAVTVVTPSPGGGTSNAVNLTVLIVVAVSPTTPTLNVTQTQPFTATVTGSANQGVSWSVNGVAGGNATVGIIDASGLYAAPAIPPSPNVVTVKAASVVDPTRTASASVTIVNPAPILTSISPSTVDGGSSDATLTVTGANFTSQSVVQLAGTPLATTFGSATQLTAVIPAARLTTAGSFAVTVVTPSPGGGTSSPTNLQVLVVVAVSPTSQTLNVTQTQQFTASITGSSNQTVTWGVNGTAGGNATVGTINSSGFYTAPTVPPSPSTVTVTATSAADTTRTASASVSIINPLPVLSSVSPNTLNAGSGNTTITVNGSGFAQQSSVLLNGTALTTTFGSSTQLTAVVPAAQLASAGSFAVTVVTPSPGGGTSNAVNLTVLIVVAVSPTTPTLNVTQRQQFTATVTGSSNQGVSWSVNDLAGGNATVGTINATGLYAAPALPPSPNVVTVKAASVVDLTRTASAAVTVVNPAPSLSSISPTVVDAGSPNTTLTVTGTSFTPQSTVQLSGISLVTTFGSSTQLTAVIPAAQLTSAGTLPVTVVTPSPGGGTSNAVDLTVLVAVAVIPSTRTLSVNQTEPFTATVAGILDQTVSWLVNDVSGGDATVGTVSATGIYIAPGAVPAPNTVIVKAVSAADPTKFGTAVVTVTLPASDNYPRPGAGSILRPVPSLPQIPIQGSAVAVLDWTAKDAYATQEDLLAVCHALSPSGIPHVHTTSVPDPSAYPFVAVAGVLDDLTNAERDALQAYVQNGGTLFLWRPSDGGLLARLGIAASYSHRGGVVRPLTFAVGTGDPALHYIDHDVEIHWQMKYPDSGSTRGYDPGTGLARAWWENGEAAVMRCDLGTGRAYVFGWRLRYVLTEAERLIVPGEEPPWTNAPILDADLCRLLLRGAYEGWATDARVRQFAPEGKPAALIVTHDVDAQVSYVRIPEFAQLESERGFKATFNMTTMPYSNGWTGTMYDVAGMQDIQAAVDLGHDVESHSVGHFPDFDDAPFGSGTETAENYMPRYSSDLSSTVGMSVLGELGVSRWLLENDFGITVEAFRSGYLLIPDAFLEGLRQTGYRRDSTYAGGVTRGYFPFALFSVSSGTVTTYPLVEYPMAIEDPTYLSEETLTQVVDAWEQVIRINYANNAPTVLNLHPVSTLRGQALEAILDRVSDLDLWIGDWKTFAEFWEAQGVTCDRWP